MSTKRHVKEIGLLILFFIVSLAVVSAGVLIQNNQNTTNTEASSYCKCDDDDKCYPDGCSRKPKTDENTFSESRYVSVCDDSSLDPGYRISDGLLQHFCSEKQPDCCFDIYKYKDSRLCCWQERYSCHPSLCEGASGGDGCGKYWDLHKGGAYGCVKPDANGDKIAAWGTPPGLPGGGGQAKAPTSTPQPPTATRMPSSTPRPQANQPTSTPTTHQPDNDQNSSGITRFPVASPTRVRQPTQSDSFVMDFKDNNDSSGSNMGQQNSTDNNPTDQNADTNRPIAFNPPQITIKSPQQVLKETVTVETVAKMNQATDKPLTVAKDTFVTVKNYDQQLEATVENWIFRIRIQLQKLLP